MRKAFASRKAGIALVAGAAALVLLAAGLFFYFWISGRMSKDSEEYEKALQQDWQQVIDGAQTVTAALKRVSDPQDLNGVSQAASQMRSSLQEIIERAGKRSVPGSYRETDRKEDAFLRAADSYLQKVEELSAGLEGQMDEEERMLLEARAREALSAANDFRADADFLSGQVRGDFFEAGPVLAAAFEEPELALQEEAEAVYETAVQFMEADIERLDMDAMWDLISSDRKFGLSVFDVTKEMLASGWRDAWGDDVPESFYVSRNSIAFDEPGVASVEVIVYLERGSPLIEDIKLVREPGGWKIRDYPFVGWGF